MKKIALLIGVLALTSGGIAQAAGWSGLVRITSLETSEVSGLGLGVWAVFNIAPFGTLSCAHPTEFILSGSATNVERMKSLAQDSILFSRSIRAYWDGTCSSSGYPVIRGLQLR